MSSSKLLSKKAKELWMSTGKGRSSRPGVFCKKGVLRNFTEFAGKYLCQSLFFHKVAGPSPATLSKKRLWHRCFPVNFVKFLKTRFLQNTSGRLLLCIKDAKENSVSELPEHLRNS